MDHEEKALRKAIPMPLKTVELDEVVRAAHAYGLAKGLPGFCPTADASPAIEQSFADLERRVQKLEDRPVFSPEDLFRHAVDLMRNSVPRSQPLGGEAE